MSTSGGIGWRPSVNATVQPPVGQVTGRVGAGDGGEEGGQLGEELAEVGGHELPLEPAGEFGRVVRDGQGVKGHGDVSSTHALSRALAWWNARYALSAGMPVRSQYAS